MLRIALEYLKRGLTKNINSNIDRQYKSITIDVTNKLNICKDNINNDNKGIYTKNIR